MRDTWWNHNTDKMIVFFLVMVLWFSTIWAALHIYHHDIDNMGAVAFVVFMTTSVSNIMGALIMIMTGRIQRAEGKTSNDASNPTDPTKIVK